MTFEEMVEAVSSEALGYSTLGVRASVDEMVLALNRAQRYVAGDLMTYAHRHAAPSAPDPFATDLELSQAVALPKDSTVGQDILDALDPIVEFKADGSVTESTLPSYCHDAIVTWAAYLLLHPDNPTRILAQYDRQIEHARRVFLLTLPNRPVQVKDGYDPYRFARSEF
jgi:hypothetical protein